VNQPQVYRIARREGIRVYSLRMMDELIRQGLTLLLAGMGTVFVFLSVLVAGMALMSRTIMSLQRQQQRSDASDEEVAAISAAIARHRKN